MKFLFPYLFLLLIPITATFGQNLQKEYYESGKIRSEGAKQGGHRTGKWTHFFPSGTVSAVEYYEDDLLHGLCEYFDAKGFLERRENWQRGLQEDSTFFYYPNGQVQKCGVFCNGLYEGIWTHYHPDGLPKQKGTYREGLPHGAWEIYDQSGTLTQKGGYREGLEDGFWQFFDQKGQIEYEGNYTNGKKTGDWFRYKKGKKKKM